MSTTLSSSIRGLVGCAMISLSAAAAAAAQSPSIPQGNLAHPPVPASVRAELIGTYSVTGDSGERAKYRVFRQDGELRIQRLGATTVARLVHEGNHVFHLQGFPEAKFVFTVNGNRQTYLQVARIATPHVASSAQIGLGAS